MNSLICQLFVVFLLALLGSSGYCAVQIVNFGDTGPDIAVEGWYHPEGPYLQFDSFFSQKYRWGRNHTKVALPVFARSDNSITISARIRNEPDQEIIIRVGDRTVLKSGYKDNDEYAFVIPAELIDHSGRTMLDITVKKPVVAQGTDGRELSIALASVRIAGEGVIRLPDYYADMRVVGNNATPEQWRFRRDPKDQGDNKAKYVPYSSPGYEDSGWPIVKSGRWNGTGAVWYRGMVFVDSGSRKRLHVKLPQGGDRRTLFVNGKRLDIADGASDEGALIDALKVGLNHVAVKLERWPNKMNPSGDTSGITWRTEDADGATNLIIESLPPNALVLISGPEGFQSYSAKSPVLPTKMPLTHFGRYRLSVTAEGKEAVIPIHFLGLTFFHWGWYGPIGCGIDGPGWKEFKPTSNVFLDQLFERAEAHPVKHHALSHDGWIYEDPATQPLTKRAARGFAAVKEKDYIAETARMISEDKLDFVGMPYVSRSIDEADGEELVRSLRFSREIYKKQLGLEPNYFSSHDGSLTPQLPQIMRLTDYDSYVFCENWWGQGSVPNTTDCVWQAMDGTSVDVLNSYYHEYSVIEIAWRAAREGKPVALSAEEFACLDRTKFLEASDQEELKRVGIVVRLISLDRYRKEIANWASATVASRDSDMAYKGWTGGSPAETEYESLNRVTQYKLAAAENAVSLARILGYELPQSEIDDIWKSCMIYNDCHTHWWSVPKEWRDDLREMRSRSEQIQRDAARFIAGEVKSEAKSVVVVNSLGWKRSAVATVELPEKAVVCDAHGGPVPQERQGDKLLFWAADVPALGVKSFKIATNAGSAPGVSAVRAGDGFELRNSKVSVIINRQGITITDAAGRVRCANATVYSVKPPERTPSEAVSLWNKPLNPEHYAPMRLLMVEETSSGPAEASVRIRGQLAYYPGPEIEGTIALGANSDSVSVDLRLTCDEPALVGVKEAGCAHEGQYIPGIFFGAPCGESDDIIVDKAYCLARDTLKCDNRETFMQLPFKYRTTNGLSLVAPASGDFAVLTHGLTDFFHVPWTAGNLVGVSFGSGVGKKGPEPYWGTYAYRLALYAPPPGKLWTAYQRAQEEIVPLEAFVVEKQEGRLPSSGFMFSTDVENVAITGVQSDGKDLQLRILELAEKPTTVSIKSLFSLNSAVANPGGLNLGSGKSLKLNMPPRALREVNAKSVQLSESASR